MSPAADLPTVKAATGELPTVRLAGRVIGPVVLARLPRALIEGRQVLPFAEENGRLHVAMARPPTVELSDLLAYLAGSAIVPALASADDLQQAITRGYRLQPGDGAGGVPTAGATEPPAEGSSPPLEEAGDAPIIGWVENLLAEAIRLRASDIHVEPLARRCRVRYRVDGVLREGASPPRDWQLPVVSRLKLMANISIAEKRRPQDGRIRFERPGARHDLRVASLPTVHGESVVMRVLDAAGTQLGLEQLGLLPDDLEPFRRLVAAPDGLTLVTGPTGSGKTTTLYSWLRELGRTPRKIITVEDPVEYQIAGINQVSVQAEIGMTFSAALRAMLRQSPDTIMVGEIRDRETAEIAIQAALTGHQVLSTLHTNDAASAVTRLTDMGAKSFLVAAALRAVVAQRLVRRVCPECAQPYQPAPRELRVAGWPESPPGDAAFRVGRGCAACEGTGYRGQVGIFEMFLVNDEIRRLIHEQAGVSRLRACARRQGRRSLREDGLRKVLAGQTTIAEVVGATLADEPPTHQSFASA